MIIQSWPPNIDQIRAVLPVSEKNIFAYGGTIYSPGSATLPAWLVAHESVHFEQQGRFPARWWKKFLKDEVFRLDQELEAHRVEWAAFRVLNRDRNTQAIYLSRMARRLSAPMYGGIITAAEARKEILDGT
jgi:hypothetical protein